MSYFLIFLFFFLGMAAFALLINSILLRFVKTLGTKNQPGAVVRWSLETKPAIGGLAFFIIFLITFCIYSIIFDPMRVFKSQITLGLLVACTLGFVLGLTDDAYNTRPLLKLAVQILCGIILLVTGSAIEAFESHAVNQILTVVWVVGIMNSINMLDNMDGIATSVSAFILLAALGYLVLHGRFLHFDFLMLLGLLASLLGFLYFNWHPSSMYMGDTGSQFLGVVLGYVGIHYCWNAEVIAGEGDALFGICSLLLVFLLPIADTTIVTFNRLRKRQSPFIGGKDHSTHNLSYFGCSDRKVAMLFCFIALGSTGVFLSGIAYSSSGNYLLLGGFMGFFLTVLILLFGVTEYNRKTNYYQGRKASETKS